MITRPELTLGILAGGRATRLGGVDKAWLEFEGRPLVLRSAEALRGLAAAVLVSANRDHERYRAHGLQVVPDRVPDSPGPLAGIDALLAACATPWLLTVPVDLIRLPQDLVARLTAVAGENGAVAADEDGPQPLVALWHVRHVALVAAVALAAGELAVHRLQARLALPVVHFPGLRFGNLNTPEDFAGHAR